jgi:hypothetical protein
MWSTFGADVLETERGRRGRERERVKRKVKIREKPTQIAETQLERT